MNYTELEKAKYEKMWGFDAYRERSPGFRHVNQALSLFKEKDPKFGDTLIDLGCGTGRVSKFLQETGFEVTALDIAQNALTEFNGRFICSSLWEIPDDIEVFRFGFCADVMEHLPPEMVPDAIACVSKHVEIGYFQIANFVCHEGDKIGEHLHLSVFPADWWEKQFRKNWTRKINELRVIENPKHHVVFIA